MSPEDHKYLTFLKKVFRHEFRKNGYRRISTPLLETTSLLRTAYPEDANQYGLYKIEDKSGNELSLPPTATVGILRSYLESEAYDQLQPLYYYYIERFFRQNRMRKEIYAIGGEVIWESDPIIDAQSLYLTVKSLEKIGLSEGIHIRINSYGNAKEMEKFYAALEDFFSNKGQILSQEVQNKREKIPLAPYFSKEEDDIILSKSAPEITKFLKKDSKKAFESFQEYLSDLQIDFQIDPTLFFLESYYTGVIWELSDSQGKIIATGWRYDGLATQLWSLKPYGASWFSIDALYLIDALKEKNVSIKNKDHIDLYFVQLWDEARRVVFPLSLEARARGINTQASLWTPSMKEQMLKAQRIGASYVVLVGLMEARNGIFQVRNLEAGTQQEVKKEDLIDYIIDKIGEDKLDFYEPSRDLVQG